MSELKPLPDMEFLVAATEYKVVQKRSPDGSLLPIFKATGSKFAYDLVCTWLMTCAR